LQPQLSRYTVTLPYEMTAGYEIEGSVEEAACHGRQIWQRQKGIN
jgi:hypothetical protein